MPPLEKEAYFTPATLSSVAQELLQAPGVEARRATPAFEPAKSALLVLDMQMYFLDKPSHAYVPSAAAIIPGLRQLVAEFYSRRLPVVFTRHTNTPQDAGLMASWWRDLVSPDDPLSLVTPLLDLSNAVIIEKRRYDAFFETPLEAHLRSWQVGQVVVTGVMTHLCCETTARSAFMRGFQPFFVVDGTATYNRQFHAATLLNLAHGFASLKRTADILAALEAGG